MSPKAKFVYRLVRVAAVAFLGVFTPFALGVWYLPDVNAAKAAGFAALTAGAAAAYHAVLQFLTTGQEPVAGKGVLPDPS